MNDSAHRKTYTCEQCGQECGGDEDWSDEDAAAEMRDNFGDLSPDDRAVVCDDCYQAMMAWAGNQR